MTPQRLARARMMADFVQERVDQQRLTIERRTPDWSGKAWCDVVEVTAMTATIRVPWRRLPQTIPLRPGELERLYRLAGGDHHGEQEEPYVLRQARLIRERAGR